tara:strand:- start:450 stop:878 length:429 start_codon:yes stop_codon:yes gene_type:complete
LAASADPESREYAAVAFAPAAVADALREMLSSRAPFRALASPPAFVGKRARAAGSLWQRSVGWHSGSGNLYGLVGVAWDARSVGRRPEGRGLPASWLAEIERAGADGFVDALETTTTIYRLAVHGRSPAMAAWQRVLGPVAS